MQPRYALPFLQPGRLARVLTSTESPAADPDGEDAANEVLLKPACVYSSVMLLTSAATIGTGKAAMCC